MLEGSCVPFPDNYLICLPQIKTVHRNRTETRQSRASRTHGPCDGGALRSPTPAQCTPRRTLPMPSASASRSSATGSSRKGKRRAGPASGKQRVGAVLKSFLGSLLSRCVYFEGRSHNMTKENIEKLSLFIIPEAGPSPAGSHADLQASLDQFWALSGRSGVPDDKTVEKFMRKIDQDK